ncbi:FecR family protein [Chitinophaga sp. CF418]|uniref:FecR family protein n=1 Tax=Chitinophaga sp. CF418 TaxID=1855287 RepID=UPI00091253A1|nr:FecR domain-containing protein [Chitinophaga sp. CF418]SHL97329.1 FecR family protein [Chitinophaga sp. CF418]
MANETEHIHQLFQLYVTNQATDEQVRELFLFLQDPANDAVSHELVSRQLSEDADTDKRSSESQKRVWENMLEFNKSLHGQWQKQKRKPAVTMMRWVAAAGLITAITTFVFVNRQPVPKAETAMDIPAGGNKAVLTLSDGSIIRLDSAINGTIARQGNVAIIKSANGEVRYDSKGDAADDEVLMNKMTTPMGGQYQIVLPDGTKAWLNAASSITYPVFFAGNDRKVAVTGEVYLEVAKDMSHPFIVDVTGHSGIEVLGTSFDINAYEDEGKIKTTLIDGRIRITGSTIILKPGQQVVESANEPLSVLTDVNIEKEIAWKNGIFYFEDASLPLVMKQLARWYNIEVLYKGAVPELRINGKMDRNLTLQGVMDFLTKMGVNYTMKSHTILVTGN